jgi:hypothetical protein
LCSLSASDGAVGGFSVLADAVVVPIQLASSIRDELTKSELQAVETFGS